MIFLVGNPKLNRLMCHDLQILSGGAPDPIDYVGCVEKKNPEVFRMVH